jgi:hypothetical protein
MSARKCAGCGRALRASPGPYGPVCARKHTQSLSAGRTGAAGPRVPPGPSQPLTARNTPPHCDGQTELPLAHHQPSLWSI